MNYIANFKDVDNNQLTLEIYNNLNEAFKEVTLTDSVEIESEDVDELTNGGIITTSLKFSLLGKTDEDFISLANSQLTEYKVKLKKDNNIIYFGYLINGVYETDFSQINNYKVQFGASDFKILEKTRSAADTILKSGINFVDVFNSLCIYKDFKDDVNINICTNKTTLESLNKGKTNNSNVETLLSSIYFEKAMMYNEKDEALNEKQIIDELLQQFGFILRQHLGKIYIYEVTAANTYNEVIELNLANFTKSNLLTINPTVITKWSIYNNFKIYGNQEINIEYKKDRLVLQFDKQYKDNFETAKFEVTDKNYKDVYLPVNRVDSYIHQTSDNPKINWFLYRVNKDLYNSNQFINDSMFFINTENVSKFPAEIKYMAGYGFWRPTTTGNKVVVQGKNTFAFNESVKNIYIRLKFDTIFKFYHVNNTDTKNFSGDIKIYVTDGDGNEKILDTKSYLCKKSDSSLFNKKYWEDVKTYEVNKTLNGEYKDNYSDEFIFSPSNASNFVLSNLRLEFYQPKTTDRGQTTGFIDFWGINNIKLDFVYLNTLGEWETYQETDAEELVIETINTLNNVTEEIEFNYSYISNDEFYPLIKNSLYEFSSLNKVMFLGKITSRTDKYISNVSNSLEAIKIDELYNQVSKTRFNLSMDIKNYYDTKPNNFYNIPFTNDRYFISNGYNLDVKNNILSLNLKEFIL